MTTSWVIQDVRVMERPEAVDIVVRDGAIAAIGQGARASAEEVEIIDGSGRLAFPGLVDAHTHMDKTLMGMGWHRHDVGPSLLNLIENERRVRRAASCRSDDSGGKARFWPSGKGCGGIEFSGCIAFRTYSGRVCRSRGAVSAGFCLAESCA